MSSNIMPPESQKFIDDFLLFLELAKSDRDTNRQFWQNLQVLEERLTAIEDKPPKLAKAIKQWCKEFGITLNREQLASDRVNMAQKGKRIPKTLAGDKPQTIYNKATIIAEVREQREQSSGEEKSA